MVNDLCVLKNISILYVEDDKKIRKNIYELLKSFAKNQYIAINGQEGL